jgi:hypothetical protein
VSVATVIQTSPRETERPLAVGQELALAAHLVSSRGWYVHHGLYVGDGRVIHYAGLSHGLHGGLVEEISLECFAAGRGVAVRTGAPLRFEAAKVVERARARLGENRYRLLTNNCEHFCEWCLRGQSRSPQIDVWLTRPRAAIGAVRAAAAKCLSALRVGRSGVVHA